MKMIMRWFPQGDDSVPIEYIRQVPGVCGVAVMLSKIPVGEVWPLEDVLGVRDKVRAAGLEMEVVESVNIHEDIKKGLSTRDRYIENYQTTIRHLGRAGVKCLCYNFMPVMDWARSALARKLPDDSTVLSYRDAEVRAWNPAEVARSMIGESRGFSLPGWEPERIPAMAADIEFYQSVTQDEYWKNMKYFLDAVVPVAEKSGIRMAIHPDDPPWELFGLPKVITNLENIRKFLALHDSKANGITLCTGSLGAEQKNDLPAIGRELAAADRLPFVHLRNIKHLTARDFDESAHLTPCGDNDMFAIVKALYDAGFDGYIRPDHGRMIWGENARPGYGLYDRALGANYILGLWEAVARITPRS
ncbi:MAG: mannonate dehydratase [Synergistaceae bacterium]|jgi:mannonate dehydratase|nr:mannonate dehydratase [Synergistaceae bacterium]